MGKLLICVLLAISATVIVYQHDMIGSPNASETAVFLVEILIFGFGFLIAVIRQRPRKERS